MVLDSTLMEENWHEKRGINSPDKLNERFERFQNWLAEQTAQKIIIVAHHNVFLHMLRFSFINCEVKLPSENYYFIYKI